MRDAKPDIEARGAALVIIGQGQPMHAKDFAEETGLEGAVFTDPSRSVYRALGMKRGLGSTFNLDALKNGIRAFKKGYRQTATRGDPFQQGGTLVISAQGVLLYGYLSEAGGDHAPVEDVLSALE